MPDKIDWMGSALFLPAKAFVGHCRLSGLPPKQIVERVFEQMPCVPKKLEEYGRDARRLIKSRATATENGEMIPLLAPKFSKLHDLLEKIILDEAEKIDAYEIGQANAAWLLMKSNDRREPAVYARWDPDMAQKGYIGDTSQELKRRDGGHRNAHHLLMRVFHTADYPQAHKLAMVIQDVIKAQFDCRIFNKQTDKFDLMCGTPLEVALEFAITHPHVQRLFRSSVVIDDSAPEVPLNPVFSDVAKRIDMEHVKMCKEEYAKRYKAYHPRRQPPKSTKIKVI